MKTILTKTLSIFALSISFISYSQVGIGTSSPTVDLDIESKIQMSRGYFGYQEKINEKDFTLGKRPSEVPENAFVDTVNIPNMNAEASEISPSINKSFEGYIKNVENDTIQLYTVFGLINNLVLT